MYILRCSTDGILIDYEKEYTYAPDFWEQYEEAEAHGCTFFTLDEF